MDTITLRFAIRQCVRLIHCRDTDTRLKARACLKADIRLIHQARYHHA